MREKCIYVCICEEKKGEGRVVVHSLSRGERYSYMFRSIVANLFANGLVPSVETILVSDSLKLSVSVEKNAVMLAGAKRFIWTRSCVSERFVSRKIKFSYAAFYASVKCEGSMLHGRRYVTTAIVKIYYPPLNLLVVCRYGRREKRSDTNGFFRQTDFLHCTVSHWGD